MELESIRDGRFPENLIQLPLKKPTISSDSQFSSSFDSVLIEASLFNEYADTHLGLSQPNVRRSSMKTSAGYPEDLLDTNVQIRRQPQAMPRGHPQMRVETPSCRGITKSEIKQVKLDKPLPPLPQRLSQENVSKTSSGELRSLSEFSNSTRSSPSPEDIMYQLVYKRYFQLKDIFRNNDPEVTENVRANRLQDMLYTTDLYNQTSINGVNLLDLQEDDESKSWESKVLQTLIDECENEMKILKVRLNVIRYKNEFDRLVGLNLDSQKKPMGLRT